MYSKKETTMMDKKELPEKHNKKPVVKTKAKQDEQPKADEAPTPIASTADPVVPPIAPTQYPPAPPSCPSQQITYPAPAQPRSGMPTWGIVLIVVGILLVLGILAIIGLAFMAFAAANQLKDIQKNAPYSTSESTSKTTRYSTSRASFSYPSSWSKQDMDPTKILNANGSTVYTATRFSNGTSLAADYREYGSGSTPSTTYYDHAKRVEAMNSAIAGITTMGSEKGIGMAESYGLGCTKDFAVTSPAKLVDKNGAVGVTFDYTCVGLKGEKTKNTRMQWYDSYSTINLLTISATENSWAKQEGAIAAVFESVMSY